jgi:hypothetical protein
VRLRLVELVHIEFLHVFSSASISPYS